MNENLVNHIKNHPLLSSTEIYNGLQTTYSYPTLKRELTKLVRDNFIIAEGKGTKYRLSLSYELLMDIDIHKYFSLEQDERQIKESFNHSLISEILTSAQLFTAKEYKELETL